MKVAAYYTIHYGVDYLAYSIKSIYDVVDEILILYSAQPSHGKGTNLICPDTEDELKRQASLNDKDQKITWIEGVWGTEGEHRNVAFQMAKKKDCDILVMVDFDEIWDDFILGQLINESYIDPVYELRIKMRHLWRSFCWACEDAMTQGRIFNLKKAYLWQTSIRYAKGFDNDYVWHFGYARSVRNIKYKTSIHGHGDEWRDDWFKKTFKKWKPGMNDVHPTCLDTWHPKEYDKNKMPEFMREHPFFNLDTIK